MEISIKIVSSLGVVAIFFGFYFRNFVFRRSAILQTTALFVGFLSAALTLALQMYGLEFLLPPGRPIISQALIDAAFVEEAVRFLFIWLLLRRSGPTFTIVEGVFDGILVGLGFALVENFHYSLNYPGFVILLRSLTSVPLHAFLSGIMAFFISYAHLRRVKHPNESPLRSARMWYLHGVAFLIPYTFHAMYDTAFLLGAFTYVVPLVLVGAFLILESLYDRARLYFGKSVLNMLGIDVEDLEIFLGQQEYERWLNDHQDEDRPTPALFMNRWPKIPTIAGGLCLSVAGIMLVWLTHWSTPDLFRYLRDDAVRVTLLVIFPATVGSILLLVDKINYLYLRDVMLSVPMALTVEVERLGAPTLTTVTMDLLPTGIFISDQTKFPANEPVLLRFRGEIGVSPRLPGHVCWSNRFNAQLPVGHIIRFDRRSPGLFWYRFRYKLYKLGRLHRVFAAQGNTR